GGQVRAGFVFTVDFDDVVIGSGIIQVERPVPVVDSYPVVVDLVGTVEPVVEVIGGSLQETEFNLMHTADGQDGVDVVLNLEGSSAVGLHPGGPPVGLITAFPIVTG